MSPSSPIILLFAKELLAEDDSGLKSNARRIAAVLLLQPTLDANCLVAKENTYS